MTAVLEIRDLKVERSIPGGGRRCVLSLPELDLGESEELCVVGASGRGKSTLLNAIAGILVPTSGTLRVTGVDPFSLSEAQRDRWRARNVGYVFQSFNLLASLTALENLRLAQRFAGADAESSAGKNSAEASNQRALEILGRVGLGKLVDQKPGRLSSGEQQRVAIARALVNRPKLVLADEPTASLDPENAARALELLRETCREAGASLLVVTHDVAVREAFPSVLELQAAEAPR